MNKKFIGLNAMLLACASIVAQEVQNDSIGIQRLDEVVVSDSRFELKRENSGKTVIKIDSEELQRNQGKSLVEIINTKSGIEITGSRGRPGAILGVFARGGRGRQVLILIDGVRVSDPSSFSSEYDLRFLSTANIASIEILKGAASTLYGTNAATAVIHITTKKADSRKIAGNFQSSLGTNQDAKDQNYNLSRFSNAAHIGGTLDKFTYQAAFTNAHSDGVSSLVTPTNEEDFFSRFSTNINLGYQFSKNFHVKVYGTHTKYKTQFDESFGQLDADYQLDSEQKRVGITSVYDYGKGSLHFNSAFSDYESDSRSGFPTIFKGENRILDLYNKYVINDKWYTVLGINYIKDEAVFSNESEFNIVDPYFNMVYVSPVGFNLNTGLRVNNHSEYGTHFVYNVNPSYSLETNKGYLKFLGSFATSYITPNLTQLFGDFGANPALEPEENRTVEGGLEYAFNSGLRISAVYFNRKEENAIGFDSNYMSINVADVVKAKGAEIELNWEPNNDLDISANYTFTELKGSTGIRIPKHKINTLLVYKLSDRTNTSISYAYTGQRFDTDFNAFPALDVALEPFSLLGFYVSHQVIPNTLNVFFNADNILNEEYIEVLGFTSLGRNMRIGFTLNL